ncbi:MAG: P-loop NTPase [Nitrospinae bacterium]|nr:P-loop NTPase [Nitrospinota bacterium]
MDEKLLNALATVPYPGFSKSLTELGAITAATFNEKGEAIISLKPISADDQVLWALKDAIKEAVAKVTDAKVKVFFGTTQKEESAPPKGSADSVFKRRRLPGVRNIIPVVSGKGGVGKSTVAINLAHTLSQLGNKVGLLDLDIFGPSAHRMLGVAGASLAVVDGMIAPHEAMGLKVISIGMAMGEDEALVIRGPMVMKLLNQLLNEVRWGELDYLVVDMPPGTGDVPLSLVQSLHVTGAVVVTTPQEISLIDVRRAVAMFRQTETHILGIVENMSFYKCEKCGDTVHIFGKGGGEAEASRLGVPLIAQVPIVKSICEGGDAGAPVYDPDKSPELAKVFKGMAQRVVALSESAEEMHIEKERAAREAAAKAVTPTFTPLGGSHGG